MRHTRNQLQTCCTNHLTELHGTLGRHNHNLHYWQPKWPEALDKMPPQDQSVWIIVFVLGFYMTIMTLVIVVGLLSRRKQPPPDFASHLQYMQHRRTSPVPNGAIRRGQQTVLTPDGRAPIPMQPAIIHRTTQVQVVNPQPPLYPPSLIRNKANGQIP